MKIDEILSRLQRNEGHFAKDAVLEAVGHLNEVIPASLDVLRDVADNPEPYAIDPDRFILTYAIWPDSKSRRRIKPAFWRKNGQHTASNAGGHRRKSLG